MNSFINMKGCSGWAQVELTNALLFMNWDQETNKIENQPTAVG